MGLKEQFLMEYWGFLWRGVVWNTSTPTHASGRVSGFLYPFDTRLVFIFLLKRRAEALSLAWETNPCKKIHRDIYRPLLSPPLKPSRGPCSPSCQTELLQVFAAFYPFLQATGRPVKNNSMYSSFGPSLLPFTSFSEDEEWGSYRTILTHGAKFIFALFRALLCCFIRNCVAMVWKVLGLEQVQTNLCFFIRCSAAGHLMHFEKAQVWPPCLQVIAARYVPTVHRLCWSCF